MSRKLGSFSMLSAVILVAIVVASATAQVDRKTREAVSGGKINVTMNPHNYTLNFAFPAPNPTYDVTGIWKSNAGDTMEVFQEKDEVNSIFVNGGWAHRLAGRYVSPTKIRLVVIRRTRAGGCEVTMDVDLNVTSVNSMSGVGVASETGCGLTSGQSYPGTWTRVL